MIKTTEVPNSPGCSAAVVASTPELPVNDVYLNPSATIKPHSHDFATVYIVFEGELIAMSDKGERRCGKGDVLAVPAGVRHGWKNGSSERSRFFSVAATKNILEPSGHFNMKF